VRRREPADPTATVPVPPPELARRCYVEDWLDLVGFTPRWAEGSGTDAWRWAARCEARRRWKTARAEWLTLHDVPTGQACAVIPFRTPIFADEAAAGDGG